MGDSIWNNFLDETMKERYELVAERIVEISKEHRCRNVTKTIFQRQQLIWRKRWNYVRWQ